MLHSQSSGSPEKKYSGRGNAATKRILIQGIPGAFHEIAAQRYFGRSRTEAVPASTFEELIDRTQYGPEVDGAIMAIENSIAGSLLANYQLLYGSDLRIVGEVYLRIKQNLLVLPGQRLEDLTEVYSHPVALAQCRPFFKTRPDIKLIENEDTALSARLVSQEGWRHAGAIASTLAAENYGLEVLAESIETFKKNYTRFLILERDGTAAPSRKFDKVSICFTLPHQVGSLHEVLAALAALGANLTKIQSVPLLDSKFEYLFFTDFLLSDQQDFDQILNTILSRTNSLKVLGTYQKGQHYED